MQGTIKSISLKNKTWLYQTIGLHPGTLRCIVNRKSSTQGTERMWSLMGHLLSSVTHIDSVVLFSRFLSSSQTAHDTRASFVQDFDSIRIHFILTLVRVCGNILWHFYQPFESIQTFFIYLPVQWVVCEVREKLKWYCQSLLQDNWSPAKRLPLPLGETGGPESKGTISQSDHVLSSEPALMPSGRCYKLP